MQEDDTPNQAHPFSKLARAAAFAAERHQGQHRKGATRLPYITHPLALVDVLVSEAGVTDITVLCAALLHDTVEDTPTHPDEIELHFGLEVRGVVMEVTDDKSLSKHARKQHQIEHAPTLSSAARLVKLADKICNLRDILAAPPEDWSTARRLDYFDWAARVVDGLRGAHAGLESIFDEVHARQREIANDG